MPVAITLLAALSSVTTLQPLIVESGALHPLTHRLKDPEAAVVEASVSCCAADGS